MAIALRGTPTAFVGAPTAGGTQTGVEPTGAQSGDVVWALWVLERTGAVNTIALPSGWTTIFNSSGVDTPNFYVAWGYVVRTGSAPNLGFTYTNTSSYAELRIWVTSGVDPTVIDDTATAVGPANMATTIDPPAVAANFSTDWVIVPFVDWVGSGAGGWAAPAGYTNISTGPTGAASAVSFLAPGSTGSKDPAAVGSTSTEFKWAHTVSVVAAGGGAANITASLAGAGALSAVVHAGVTEVATGPASTATSGDVTANYPTGVGQVLTGDIIVCDVSARDNVTVTFPGGWTKKAEANNGTGLRKTIAWKRRAGGDSDTSVAVTHTGGAQIIARVHVIRGALASGDPFEATGGPTSISAASTGVFPDVTTLSAGALLFYTFAYGDDFATAPAITNAQGLTLTERDSTEVP